MISLIERLSDCLLPTESKFFLEHPRLGKLTKECAGAWGETCPLSPDDQLRMLVKAGMGIIQAIWSPDLRFPEKDGWKEEDFKIPREVQFFLPGEEPERNHYSYNLKDGAKSLAEEMGNLVTESGSWDEILRFLNNSRNGVIKRQVGTAIGRIVGLAGNDNQGKINLVYLAVNTMHDLITELAAKGVDLHKFAKITLFLVPKTNPGNVLFVEPLDRRQKKQ